MQSRSIDEGRVFTVSVIVLVMFLLTAWMLVTDRSEAASVPSPEPAARASLSTDGLLSEVSQLSGDNIYAKYEGFDGEVVEQSHDKWIQILAMEWGAEYSRGPVTGPTRRVGSPILDDLVLTFDYEKATPKLLERLVKGMVIPALEIEFTTEFENRATYLRYELKNVLVTGYEIVGMAGEGRPTVAFAHNFEEIKVTYTEYDDEGGSLGNVEFEYKVDKGA